MKRAQEETTPTSLKLYRYREAILSCQCGWTGKGKNAKKGDNVYGNFYLDCPQCPIKSIAFVNFPTIERLHRPDRCEIYYYAMKYDSLSYHKYYKYKNEPTSCSCGWSGLCSEASLNEWATETVMYLDCPKCYKIMIAAVLMPTNKQIEKYASVEEKESIRKRAKFIEDYNRTVLKSSDQLPDIEGTDKVILIWDITGSLGNQETVVMHNDQEIWRQVAAYEGYGDFLEFCKLAKGKYKARLVDVIPTKKSEYDLYGDYLSSPYYVDRARKSLSENK